MRLCRGHTTQRNASGWSLMNPRWVQTCEKPWLVTYPIPTGRPFPASPCLLRRTTAPSRWNGRSSPLQLCSGRTVNRSQGVTEPNGGVIDFRPVQGKKPWVPLHAHYVALSRYTCTQVSALDQTDKAPSGASTSLLHRRYIREIHQRVTGCEKRDDPPERQSIDIVKLSASECVG